MKNRCLLSLLPVFCLLSGVRGQTCEREACREHSPTQQDGDCCGNPNEVWCAEGYTLSFVVINEDWAYSDCEGSSTPIPGPQSGSSKIGNTCCTPYVSPPPAPPSSGAEPYRYELSASSMSWHECDSFCSDDGGEFTCIGTEEVNNAIEAAFGGRCPEDATECGAWFGLTDEGHDGDWQATCDGGLSDFRPWASGEPNGGEGENCANIWGPEGRDGGWNDYNCDSTMMPCACRYSVGMAEPCTLGNIQQQLQAINDICCANGECDSGGIVPDTCSCACSEVYGQTFHHCQETLDNIASLVGGSTEAYGDFENLCQTEPTGGDQCCDSLDARIDTLESQIDEANAYIVDLEAQVAGLGVNPDSCDDSWTTAGNSCYKCFTDSMSWFDAEAYCNQQGAKLAQINDDTTNEVVKGLCPAQTPYIGLTDAEVENSWKWSDGSTAVCSAHAFRLRTVVRPPVQESC